MERSDSQIVEFLETFRKQKERLRQEREEKVSRLRAKKAKDEKQERLKRIDTRFKHNQEWNPSINTSWFHHYEHKAMEPNPDGKPFDCEGKSLWPVVGCRKERFRTPWYSVRSGELFSHVPHNVATEEKRTETPKKTTEKRLGKSWRTASCPPGRLFGTYLPDPSVSVEAKEKLVKLFARERAAQRDPWLPTKSTTNLFQQEH